VAYNLALHAASAGNSIPSWRTSCTRRNIVMSARGSSALTTDK